MTQNEVDIIKNAVLDATEAYVDARLSVLDFVKTQIGVTVGDPAQRQGKYYHTVRCNATQSTPQGITYNNVLSVGNIPFPNGSVVFVAAPNAQFSSQFILGKLDNTPCNISAGSITLGDAIYLTSTPEWDSGEGAYCYGHIAKFKIYNDYLLVGDAKLSKNVIGCGEAGNGIVNMVGGNNMAYIQISDSGNPYTCLDGIRIRQDGQVYKYHANGSSEVFDWDRQFELIPTHNLYYHSDGSVEWY